MRKATLQEGKLDRLDRGHLIEYLTDMAARDRRELESSLTVLYAHILKFQLQPGRITRSWRLTVAAQQRAITRIIQTLPSLGQRADDMVLTIYPDAVRAALIETGADKAAVPSTPEFNLARLLSFDPARHGTGRAIAGRAGR